MVVKFRKEEFLRKLEKRIFVLDGAMGTELQKRGFTKGCPDELNIKNPALVKAVHKSYADAGSDIIITNTFGANRIKLGNYKIGNKVKEINEAGVKIARDACPGCLIAGDVGPLGKEIEPLGELTFGEAYDTFKEQILALKEADLLIIETISDIKVLKAAIIAAKETFEGPIISSMTIQDGRTTTGTDIETYVTIADTLGADIIGVNCSDGPDGMHETAKLIAKNTNKPICLQPNAGMPKMIGEDTVWDYPIDKFAGYAEKFVKLGANIVGGCCGTNPDFIKAIADKVKKLKPVERKIKEKTKLCSRTRTAAIEGKTLIVGERINPTNKKDLQDEIKKGETNIVRREALEQVKEGAAFLDINIGVPGADEASSLRTAVGIVQNIVNAPLVIDTADFKALEAALQQSDGKPLINSVNGSEKSLNGVLPLAKKYGAAIIALTLDEKGIPKTKEKRIEIAKKIINEAEKAGIKKEDIIVDCLALTIATNPENENIILDSVKEIKKLGYKTILGVSNISHGLADRAVINNQFLEKAKKAGLDLAIFNPAEIGVKGKIRNIKAKKVDYTKLPIEKQLYSAILYGDNDNIVGIINNALKKLSALGINDILIKALEEVGRKFKCKEYFLPHVLLSAGAMKKAFERLKNEIRKEGGKSRGKILFATVKDDIHDIGKNIVIALLESNNYDVVDLGADVPTKRIINITVKEKPDMVCLSALMTTTVREMENVIKELRLKGIKIPVLVGGAVVTDDYAKSIRAGYGKDALDAVKKANEIVQ